MALSSREKTLLVLAAATAGAAAGFIRLMLEDRLGTWLSSLLVGVLVGLSVLAASAVLLRRR